MNSAILPTPAEGTPPNPQAGVRRFISLLAVLWILAFGAFFASAWHLRPMLQQLKAIQAFSFNSTSSQPLPSYLNKEQQLLLGDPTLTPLEQKEQLLASDPDHPAYLAAYVGAYLSAHDALPPDWQSQAARIDPDNALYHYYAATQGIDEVLKKEKPHIPHDQRRILPNGRMSPELRPSTYTILKRDAFDASIAQLVEASKLPRVENAYMNMARAQVDALQIKNYVSFLHAIMITYDADTHITRLTKSADLINARADELAAQGDAAGFRDWCAVREQLINQLLASPEEAVINELVYAAFATTTAVHLHKGASKLGLNDLAATYGKQQEAFQRWKDIKRAGRENAVTHHLDKHGSIMSVISFPVLIGQVENPLPINDDDLKPMRLTEHEMWTYCSIGAVVGCLILFALLHLLARAFLPAAARRPTMAMISLLTRKDWLVITGVGIVLPIALHLLLMRYSPVGVRDYGLKYLLFLVPAIPYASLLIALLLLPSWLIQLRLRRQAPDLFPPSQLSRLQPILIILLIVAVLLTPLLLVWWRHNLGIIAYVSLPCLILLTHWIANAWRACFHGSTAQWSLAVSATALQPIFPIAILALTATLPIPIASEQHWIQQDRLHLPTMSSSYEYQIAMQMRIELQQRLGR